MEDLPGGAARSSPGGSAAPAATSFPGGAAPSILGALARRDVLFPQAVGTTSSIPGAAAGSFPGAAHSIPGATASFPVGAAHSIPGATHSIPGAAHSIPGAAAGRHAVDLQRPDAAAGSFLGAAVGSFPGADSQMDEFDKADWNSCNNAAFCKICVEEIAAGNRPIGVMTTRGYKNIAEKYLLRTGLRHSRTQLKNRWDALKGLYNFWLNPIEKQVGCSFGVLKMKWRILLDLPSYPMLKQTRIILACMALHNFIRDSAMSDEDFDMCDQDENYMPMHEASSSQKSNVNGELGDEDGDMNVFRDNLANALIAMRE